jgi:hypothetical protein
MIEDFAQGNYRFLAAPADPCSSGIVAHKGYDLVHAVFFRPVPLEHGFRAAQSHVEAKGRRFTDIGAFELRIPEAFTQEGFDRFNVGYVKKLEGMGISGERYLPTARTNVAPTTVPVKEPSLYAFTYTVPGGRMTPAFRLSGSAETRRDGSSDDRVRSIIETLEERMAELDVEWSDCTAVNLYSQTSALGTVEQEVLKHLGDAAFHGITWFPSLPPIRDLYFELDVRGVGTELTL